MALKELKIPFEYKKFLNSLLTAMQDDNRIDQVYLFGSCVRGDLHSNSDVDIAVITKEQLSIREEMSFYDYLFSIKPKDYIPCDMLVMSRKQFEDNKESDFYVQRQINAEGVALRECLQSVAVSRRETFQAGTNKFETNFIHQAI
jgi:predicted nucleotidyltransferase